MAQLVKVYENKLILLFCFCSRGMRFENVAKLVNGIEDILQEMRYSWVDSHGLICHQESTFRINCMDCLDRTNVVQVIPFVYHNVFSISNFFIKHQFNLLIFE